MDETWGHNCRSNIHVRTARPPSLRITSTMRLTLVNAVRVANWVQSCSSHSAGPSNRDLSCSELRDTWCLVVEGTRTHRTPPSSSSSSSRALFNTITTTTTPNCTHPKWGNKGRVVSSYQFTRIFRVTSYRDGDHHRFNKNQTSFIRSSSSPEWNKIEP